MISKDWLFNKITTLCDTERELKSQISYMEHALKELKNIQESIKYQIKEFESKLSEFNE